MDGDGDSDLILGNSNGEVKYLKNENGTFVEEITHTFTGLFLHDKFTPSFIDLDGDGDKDLVGSVYSESLWIEYYKNENGEFVQQYEAENPFREIWSSEEGRSELADIDNDGDLDLFLADEVPDFFDAVSFIRFFRNTGTAQNPVFTEQTGSENPLSAVSENFTLFPRLLDIDHDGDLDALIGEGGGVVETADGNEFSWYENTGTVTAPVFAYRGDLVQQGSNPSEPAPSFADHDRDGDLDIFVGSSSGTISYYKNINPAAVASINTDILSVAYGSGPVIIDPLLVLSDADNDSIVYASVAINSFRPGQETLQFTPATGVTGAFNTITGVLTFRGKAPIAIYQTLLRSVALEYTGTFNGRKRDPEQATIARSVTFHISDADGTHAADVSRTLNISSGQAPVFDNAEVSTTSGGTVNIDLLSLISDSDGDIDAGTLSVIQQPASGALATITENGELIVDYNGIAFYGSESVIVAVCDSKGDCDQSTITITVSSGEIEIFNAVAPNSPHGNNKFMRIRNLPRNNKVTIFNRWGDKVFQVNNYDDNDPGKRFDGKGENGNMLPSGTYFYTIDFTGDTISKPLTGYLALKQ
jgi:gliding motility-associated-like protein